MRTLRWLDGVLIFGVSYLASAIVVFPLAAVLPLREVTGVSIVVLVGIAYVWVRAVAGSPARYAGVGAVSPRVLILTVIASFAVMVPAMSLEAVVLERFKAPPEVIHALEDLIRARNFPEMLYAILVAAVGASVSEEFVFRGILQNSLSSRVSAWAALIITTTVFALLHTLWRFPGAFMLGLFLGFLYMRTGSLIPGLVSHVVINGTSVVLFNMAESATTGIIPAWMEQDRPAPAWLLGAALVVFAVVIAALWRETGAGPYPLAHGGHPDGSYPFAHGGGSTPGGGGGHDIT
jgi:membrane protease YdiL (CAAX protease family)